MRKRRYKKDACFQVAPITEAESSSKMHMKISHTHILLTGQGIKYSTIIIKGLGSLEESLIQPLK